LARRKGGVEWAGAPRPPPCLLSTRADVPRPAFPSRLELLLRRRCVLSQTEGVDRPRPARPSPPSYGILTVFPFDSRQTGILPHSTIALTNLSGSAHSVLTAIQPKPFPSSVENVLNFLITTTTKICTRGDSRPARAGPSPSAPTLSYSRVDDRLRPARCGISRPP